MREGRGEGEEARLAAERAEHEKRERIRRGKGGRRQDWLRRGLNMRRGRGSGEGRKVEGRRQDWLRRGLNMRRGRGSGEGREGEEARLAVKRAEHEKRERIR